MFCLGSGPLSVFEVAAARMPVAGLPAALDVLLTSLLTTEELSSWKVDGERESAVVVLRFRQQDGQPLLSNDNVGYWKRKTPAQRHRDQLRAEQRRKGERRRFPTFLKPAKADVDVAKSIPSTYCDARDSRHDVPTHYVPTPTMTSDPSSCADETEIAISAVIQNPSPSDPSIHDEDPDKTSSKSEATVHKDLEKIMKAVGEHMSRRQEEFQRKLKSELDSIRSADRNDDRTDPLPTSPGDPTNDPETSLLNSFETSVSRPRVSRPRVSTTFSGSAVPLCGKSENINKEERRRTPPRRQQPPRATRTKWTLH